MAAPEDATAALYEQHAGRLFGIAYRMLGSVVEAQDAVQDAFVRWASADSDAVRDPAAWLTTTLSRICLDRLKSAQRRRETYIGPWLPEPLATDDVDPADAAGTADSLTFAFLVLLELLSPLERAVFVLHDVFGHPHAEVAAMLDRSPAAVRQLAVRARRHLQERQQRHPAERESQYAVTEAFLAACDGGDVARMLELLSPDVVFVGDGGGVTSAARHPVEGADRVAQLLLGLWRIGRQRQVAVELLDVNYSPALAVRDGTTLETVLVFEVSDGHVTAIRGVRNPAKLAAFSAGGRVLPRP